MKWHSYFSFASLYSERRSDRNGLFKYNSYNRDLRQTTMALMNTLPETHQEFSENGWGQVRFWLAFGDLIVYAHLNNSVSMATVAAVLILFCLTSLFHSIFKVTLLLPFTWTNSACMKARDPWPTLSKSKEQCLSVLAKISPCLDPCNYLGNAE